MIYEIKNDLISASIDSVGGQLLSVVACGKELIWDRNPDVWGACAPILFPTVGDLNGGVAIFDGTQYPLQKHGFARFLEFEGKAVSEEEVIFTLVANSETLQKYPFDFKLDVIYKVCKDKLSCTFKVTNNGDCDMPYCIGAHPAFKTNLCGTCFENSYIEFECDETFEIFRCGDSGLICDHSKETIGKDKILPIKFSHFDSDACIYKNVNSRSVKLKNTDNDNEIQLDFSGFEHLGVWTFKGKNAEYICLEPWHGIPDSESFGIAEFATKPNCTVVKSGCFHETSFEISARIKD